MDRPHEETPDPHPEGARPRLGVESLRCITPDGMSWVFQQAAPGEIANLGA